MGNANTLNNQNLATFTISPGNLNMDDTNSAGSTGVINLGLNRTLHDAGGPGNHNIFVGANAGNFTTTGSNNTGVGYQALNAIVSGSDNTGIGSQALAASTFPVTTSGKLTAVGSGALASNTTGVNSVAVGYNALNANTTSTNNTAVGTLALALCATDESTAVGFSALGNNATGVLNVAVGAGASASTGASFNFTTAVGYRALYRNTSGDSNTVVGYGAAQYTTTGGQNTAVGQGSLLANIAGQHNTALGYQALQAPATGSDNIAVGYEALGSVTTGGSMSRNICIGFQSGVPYTGSEADNICIGYQTGVNGESNVLRIGNGTGTATGNLNQAFVAGISGVGVGTSQFVMVNSEGQLGTSGSVGNGAFTWTSYPTTISSSGGGAAPGAGFTVNSYYLQLGKMLSLTFQFGQTTTGTAGTGVYLFSIPSAFTIDTTICPVFNNSTPPGSRSVVGTSQATVGTTAGDGGGYVGVYNSKNLFIYVPNPSSVTYIVGSTNYDFFDHANLTYSFNAQVPIV